MFFSMENGAKLTFCQHAVLYLLIIFAKVRKRNVAFRLSGHVSCMFLAKSGRCGAHNWAYNMQSMVGAVSVQGSI